MRYLLPLLFLACASPTEYRRGTFTPPPPAPVRIGVGAPVVGQPGMQPRTIPRGPDRRVLPPTRGPGIWASDKPTKDPDGFPLPTLLGIRLPVPDEPTDLDWEVASLCAKEMTRALKEATLHDLLAALTTPERMCAAAKLHAACAGDMAERNSKLPTEAKFLRDLAAASRRMRSIAAGFEQRACKPPVDVGQVDDLMRTLFMTTPKGVH